MWLSWQRIYLQWGRPKIDPWIGMIPWRRARLLTPVFWPGEFHGLCTQSMGSQRVGHNWATCTHIHGLTVQKTKALLFRTPQWISLVWRLLLNKLCMIWCLFTFSDSSRYPQFSFLILISCNTLCYVWSRKNNYYKVLKTVFGNRNINPSTYKCSILFSLLFLFYPNHFFLQRSFSNLPFSSVLLETFDFHSMIPRQISKSPKAFQLAIS